MKIVYIEDNLTNGLLLKAMVKKATGVELSLIDNAEEGLKQINSALPDLVFMDNGLPNMTGIEATKKLREKYNHRELPVVMLTADATPETREQAILAGVNEFYTKPISFDDVKQVVSAAETANLV